MSDNASMEAVFSELGANLQEEGQTPPQEEAPAVETKEVKPKAKAKETTPEADAEPPVPEFLKAEEEDTEEPEDPDKFLESLKDAPGDNIEEWRANKEKGLKKIVDRAKAREAEVAQREAQLANLESYVSAFESDNWQDAYRTLGQQLEQMHGTKAVQAVPQGASEAELIENETWDQIKARWFKEFKDSLTKEIGSDLAPVKEFVQTEQQRRAAQAKASGAFADLSRRYGEVATLERVQAAVDKYPSLDAGDAFRAMWADEIGRHYAGFAASREKKPVREMIGSEALASRDAPERQPGDSWTMDDIFKEIQLQAE